MVSLSNFEPVELGLPDSYAEFRDIQIDAVEKALNSNKRFVGLCCPTGSGKSLISVALAKASGLRTAILTSTRGLEDQYINTFSQSGVCDIRGKNNYTCTHSPVSCRFGQHEGCKQTEYCSYEIERHYAKEAGIVLTNYSYWVRINQLNRGLELGVDEGGPNPFGLLVCDEAHRTMEELGRNLQVRLKEQHLTKYKIGYVRSDDISSWSINAAVHKYAVEGQLKYKATELRYKPTPQRREAVAELEELQESLGRIALMNQDHWVCEMQEGTKWGRVWTFDSIWPGSRAEYSLFLGIPKIVFMSATLRPLSLKMLNIDSDSYDFFEWPRVFPAHHTPVYHIPTVKLNHRTSDEELLKWVGRIDEILESRLDRKAIVHTVSYARQQYLLAHSRFKQYFVVNTSEPESDSAADVVAKFKRMDAPAILCSPSMATGWDFPGRECELQIITKMPWPDARSKVIAARKQRNKSYVTYLVMQELVQACGRGTRSSDDRCEVFVVDSGVEFFMKLNRHLSPRWFSITTMRDVPPPGPRAPDIARAV